MRDIRAHVRLALEDRIVPPDEDPAFYVEDLLQPVHVVRLKQGEAVIGNIVGYANTGPDPIVLVAGKYTRTTLEEPS